MLIDELRQVFVAGRDDRLKLLLAGATSERRNHVVGFDAFNLDDRPAQRTHCCADRLNLAAEIVWHCGPIRLVFGKKIIAKRLTLGIENAREMLRFDLLPQYVQHRNEAAKRAGRLAARGAQIRQRVVCAV